MLLYYATKLRYIVLLHCFTFILTLIGYWTYDKVIMSNYGLGTKPKNIRSRNTKLIIELYRENETLSVSEISKSVKLSRTTVMIINEELLDKGIIEDAGKGDSSEEGGKRPSIFRFNSRKNLILAFHIKYDRIQFRLSDLKYQKVVNEETALKVDEPFDTIAIKMKGFIKKHEAMLPDETSFLACLVAIHGNVNPDTGICIHSTYFPSWGIYSNLKETLQNTLNLDCPIHLDNWIRYKAYGENKLGCASSYDTVVLIDAGWHGVTSGILLDGLLYPGKHYLSGEIGHITVNREDKEICACGSKGCLEQQLSIKRLNEKIQNYRMDFPGSILINTEDDIDIETILKASESEDPLARKIVDEVIYWFSISISQIIMFFDPELILIEGDYSCQSEYFEKGIKSLVKELAFPRLSIKKTRILFNSGESIPTLKGAAAYGVDHYFNIQ